MTIQKSTLEFKDRIKDYSGLAGVPWARLSDQPGQNPRQAQIVINTKETFQTYLGTGGAFSEIGGKALRSLSKEDQEGVLKALFDSEVGAGFTNCRLPIGSSDFAFEAYSLNDTDGDYDMAHFSLDRDRAYLMPFMKDAYNYARDLRIHASPWSPPAWLKDTKDFVNGGSLVDDEKTYKAYALYLAKYVQAYRSEGIHIDKVLIQNEPDSPANFPSCIMPPDQMAKFAVDYLRPTFDKEGLDAEIWAGTFRTITGFQAHDFMKAPGVSEAIDGVGFQYALTQHINDFTRQYPGTRVMHTETPCYMGENTWEQAIGLFNYFIDHMNAGCEIFSYWNMILDEKSESTWGWKQNSLLTIKDNGEVVYNPDFYVMKALSKDLKPGAKRVQCLCMVKESIAFINPDGSIVILVSNLNDQDTKAVLTVDDQELEMNLKGSSITTYVIQ